MMKEKMMKRHQQLLRNYCNRNGGLREARQHGVLKRRTENIDFSRIAKKSIGGASEEILRRFLNFIWTDRSIERGYIADEEEMKDFVRYGG